MDEPDLLAQRFEANRATLHAVAHRMLGSAAEADDAVQEAWLRLSRSGADGVDNLAGWLTTVVGRVCLDMLRSRRSRREEPLDTGPAEPPVATGDADPERAAVLADAVGPALMVVLDALGPAERLAFVLHDLFAVPFDEIAAVLGRSPAATRQLASRARRRVQGVEPAPAADLARRRAVVDAFLAASREGDFAALVDLLDPDVELRGAPEVVRPGSAELVRGADAVARVFAGRAKAALPATADGEPCLVWMYRGEIRSVFSFTIDDGRVTAVELITDPDQLGLLDVELVRGGPGAARRAGRDGPAPA
jgi:RNA polymerase sigma-70 factor, ECF subfamily